jgi:hypothetical protein
MNMGMRALLTRSDSSGCRFYRDANALRAAGSFAGKPAFVD